MRHFCYKCNRETDWELKRKYEICEGCGDKFPCPRKCDHIDCEEAKKDG